MSVRVWKAEVGSEALRDMKLYMSSTRDVMSLVDSLAKIQLKERKPWQSKIGMKGQAISVGKVEYSRGRCRLGCAAQFLGKCIVKQAGE